MMSKRILSYIEALREALREEMLRDENVFVMGEDVRPSVFGVTSGLWKEFGDLRVINTPISESAFVGASVGAAATGLRPVVSMMFSDFMPVAMDQFFNQMSKMRYMFGGKIKLPIVVRAATGAGLANAAQHSSSIYSWFTNMPGLKVVIPSTPYDAKGLLKTAIRDDNPVLFFEHKKLFFGTNMLSPGLVPEEEYLIPLGKADIKREGKDVTIVATSLMVSLSMAAASTLEEEGINVEVIDPRTLVPFDKKAVLESIKKTGRLVIVDEAPKTCGAASEIAAIAVEEAFDYLQAPVKRVTTLDTPIPFCPRLETHVMPSEDKIVNAVREIASHAS